jgi:hypothetical protein
MRSLAIILVLAILASTAAGSDGEWKQHRSVEEEFKDSTCVFVGKVVRARQVLDGDHFIQGTFYTVKVEEPLRGIQIKQVEIYDENSSGRFPMKVGARYVLFAYEGVFEGVRGPRLAVDNCGNSGTLKEAGKVLATTRNLKTNKGPTKGLSQ